MNSRNPVSTNVKSTSLGDTFVGRRFSGLGQSRAGIDSSFTANFMNFMYRDESMEATTRQSQISRTSHEAQERRNVRQLQLLVAR